MEFNFIVNSKLQWCMCIAKYLQHIDKSLHVSLKYCRPVLSHPVTLLPTPQKNPLQTAKTMLSSLKSSRGGRNKREEVISSRSRVATILSDLHIEFTTKISFEGKL